MSNLTDIIAFIESRNIAQRVRFEPLVYGNLTTGAMTPNHARIVSRIAQIHACSIGTAQMIYSTSWGLYQLMGFNLYDDESVHFTEKPFFDFVCDPIEQARVFTAFVNSLDINWTPDYLASSQAARNTFAMKYNGALSYATLISGSLIHSGYQVV